MEKPHLFSNERSLNAMKPTERERERERETERERERDRQRERERGRDGERQRILNRLFFIMHVFICSTSCIISKCNGSLEMTGSIHDRERFA